VTLKNLQTGDLSDTDCDGVFMALGHLPNTKLFKRLLDMDSHGFIVTSRGTATSIPGVFAAGDVTDPTYKQAVTAAGMGCMAALDAERYLRNS
jgi:thioredoxin reductase (NADPH)